MRGAAFPLASVSCLLSGVAALTHQVVWQRLLVLPLGADVYFDDGSPARAHPPR